MGGAGNKVCITYIGHATLLIEMDGVKVLTDPMFSKRALIIPRLKPPAMRFEDIPSPDIVLLSHSHYDHLDQKTVRKLPVKSFLVIPVRTRDLIDGLFGGEILELKWWEYTWRKGLKITAVPAKHHGMRFLTDFHRGYTGYYIEGESAKVYFAGDTAYFDGFKKMREEIGSPDIALLPIGAYSPRFYMKLVHMNPEEAVQAFLDLGAKYMIPIHWGTFRLSLEPPDEPIRRLRTKIKELGLDEKIIILKHGERKCF